ncbi:general stress protein [Lichenibacterium ramalinae]|uniref:general stress protein n=1 Tax=Lichenibacterium ramalinae TaxID=2316527 RepID=UPI001A91DC68|nr:general stress protein [Lichenibacterium ramalinae]
MATRTATALYHSYASAADAVGKLEAAGIPHDNISIVSNDEANTGQYSDHPGTGAGASFGTVLGGGAGLLAGLGMLAIPGLGPVVAAGWLASTLVGAGVGAAAGGLVGALTDAGIDHGDADAYAEGVRRGGTLVTVRADEAQIDRATQILDVDGAVDLDERRTAWGQDGWTAGPQTTFARAPEDRTAGERIADGATRAKDAVERAGARVADAVTPDSRPAGTGFGGTPTRAEPGVTGTGLGTGTGLDSGTLGSRDNAGRRVRLY